MAGACADALPNLLILQIAHDCSSQLQQALTSQQECSEVVAECARHCAVGAAAAAPAGTISSRHHAAAGTMQQQPSINQAQFILVVISSWASVSSKRIAEILLSSAVLVSGMQETPSPTLEDGD